MTDKELLELAAKAAGINTVDSLYEPNGMFVCAIALDENLDHFDWNPIVCDGDALRLAVDLKITVGPELSDVIGKSLCRVSWLERTRSLGEYGDGCKYAATRRAIVRAAAEIGKAL